MWLRDRPGLTAGRRRWLGPRHLLTALGVGLVMSAPFTPAAAAPGSMCEDFDPGAVRASAELALELDRTTQRITSSVTVDVPASSRHATRLLTDELPEDLSSCLPLLWGYDERDESEYTAELDGDKVTIRTTVTREGLGFFYFDSLWSVSTDERDVDVRFDTSQRRDRLAHGDHSGRLRPRHTPGHSPAGGLRR